MAHYHPYHLVEPSPYPYMTSFGALGLTVGSVMYFQSFSYGNILALFSFIFITVTASM
jgi:multisubunit Na+/H+ antiporter MnhG subunit